MEIDRELLKGSVSLVLLTLLSRAELYGYEILQEAARRSGNGFELKEGTLYPALHQLENKGLVKAAWRTTGENGRERKYYGLTAKGRKAAAKYEMQWRHLAGAIAAVLAQLMDRFEELVATIVAASGIPSATRRRNLSRELCAHINNFACDARRAGHSDAEIERMVLARFGDPREMSRNFARVYRRDRAALRLITFAISTAIVATLTSGGILAVQFMLAAGFGYSFNRRHTSIELLDILATVAGYSALLSFESLFSRRALLRAGGALLAMTAAVACVCAAIIFSPAFVLFGCVNAIFLRSTQAIVEPPGFRFAVVVAVAGFAAFALTLSMIEPSRYPVARVLVSWAALGAGYQLMTSLAERTGRGLRIRMEQL